MRGDDLFGELRRRLDCLHLAQGWGLKVRPGYFECPDPNCTCHKRHRAVCKCTDGEMWTCQACGLHGDAVDMIQVFHGLDKRGAIEEAKRLAGIVDGKPMPPPPRPRPRPKPPKITIPDEVWDLRKQALTVAEDHYDRLRRDGAEYLETLGPGMSDLDRQETMRLLPVCWDYLNKVRGIAPLMELPVRIGVVPWWRTGLRERLDQEGGHDLVHAGIDCGLLKLPRGELRTRDVFEAFRGRLFLPWHDEDGRVCNAKGRGIMDLAEPCRLGIDDDGSLSYPMHFLRVADHDEDRPPQVRRPTLPFGWHQALEVDGKRRRSDDQVPTVIAEGEIDTVSALIAGIPSVGTGGTSGVGAKRLRDILNGRRWHIIFDGDKAGRRGAEKLSAEIGVPWSVAPPEMDLNDVLKKHGPGALRLAILEMVRASVEPVEGVDFPPPEEEPPPPPDEDFGPVGDPGPPPPGPPPEDFGPEPPPPPDGGPPARTTIGMPPGWGMRGDMLCRIRVDRNGNEDWEETGIHNPPLLSWRGRDVLNDSVVVALVGNVVASSQTVEVSLPRERIKTTREIVPALAGHGYDVDSTTAGDLVRFLTAYEHAFGAELPFRLGSSQMGWHRGSFLYGRDCFGPERLHYIGEEVRILDALATSGDAEAWVEGCLRPMERYPAALFGLYAAMCAPVIAAIPDLSGFGLEYAGSSSAGKSTASSVIASAFGDPRVDGGLLRPPYDTFASLELYAALMNNLPVFLEDSHVMDADRARDLVMAWVNGQGKGRSKSGGVGRQEPKRWATVSILTGEASICTSTSYAGVGSRVLAFPPPLPRIDDNNPDQRVLADIKLMDRTKVRHYGHAGRAWVKHLVAGGTDRVLEAYDHWLGVYQKVATNDGPQQRWAKDLALTTAVASEAHRVIGGIDPEDICVGISVAFLEDTKAPDQAEDAMDLALAWVAMENLGGVEGDDEVVSPGQAKVWFRILDDGTVCVAAAELKTRLRAEGIQLTQVRKVWHERGYLMAGGVPANTVKVRLASGTTACVPISPTRADAQMEKDRTGQLAKVIGRTLH